MLFVLQFLWVVQTSSSTASTQTVSNSFYGNL